MSRAGWVRLVAVIVLVVILIVLVRMHVAAALPAADASVAALVNPEPVRRTP